MTFGRHFSRVATALLCMIIVALLVWVTWRVFGPNSPQISGGAATAYGAFVGSLVAAVFGLYKWARRSE